MDDFSVDIRQAEIPACVSIGQFLVVETEKVENGGLQVVDVDPVFHCPEAEVIGCSMDVSTLNPSACQPRGIAPVVVVTSVDLAGIGSFLWQLHGRCSPEFAAPDNQGLIE